MRRAFPLSTLAGAVLSVVLCPMAWGYTWSVSTVGELNSAFSNYNTGDEIVIQPGTYVLTQYLWPTRPNVTVRGATGNRDDVIFSGNGMNVNSGLRGGISIATDDAVVRDLTFQEFYHHGIHLRAENDADRAVISNVRTVNCGQRHIKGSCNSSTPQYICEDCLIENVLMEQTVPLQNHSDNDYIGGIDAMGLSGTTIRDCQAINIQGATGGGQRGYSCGTRCMIALWRTI